MSDSMEKWKQERRKLSSALGASALPSRAREINLAQSTKVVQKETKSLTGNEGEKSQRESVSLSQSLDSFSLRVQENKAIIQSKVNELNGLVSSCGRQSDKICECRLGVNQSTIKITNDAKLKELFSTRYNRAYQMIHKLYSNSKCVTDSLHQVAAVRETFGSRLDEMKVKAEEMNNYLNETSSVNLKGYEKCLMLLKLEEKNIEDDNVGTENWINSFQQQSYNEKILKREEDTADEESSNDIHSKILEAKKISEDLSNHSEKTHMEKDEQKHCLQKKLELVKGNFITVEEDLVSLQQEYESTNTEVYSLQSELAESGKRVDKIQNVIEQLQGKTDDLKESLSQSNTEQKDIEAQLILARDTYGTHIAEIEETKKQLSDEKNSTDQQVKVLEEELLTNKLALVERKQSLQEALQATRSKGSDILLEEENLQSALVQLQSDLETVLLDRSQLVEANSSLENYVATIDSEIQHLTKEAEEQRRSIDNEIRTTKILEQSLTTSKHHLEESLSEYNHDLTVATNEESCATEELNAVETEDQELVAKIQMLQNEIAESQLMTTQQHNLITKELKERILKLQGEVESESKKKEVQLNTFEQKVELKNGDIMKANALINSLQNSISSKNQELKRIEIAFKNKLDEKRKSEKIVVKSQQEILKCEENLHDNHKKGEEMTLKLQDMDLKMESLDKNIDELQLVQKEKETLLSSSLKDYDKEKQILLRDTFNYNSTAECCADEAKLLKKQLISWKEKLDNVQGESVKVTGMIESLSSSIENFKIEVNDLDRKKQEHLKRSSVLAKDLRQVEIETSHIKAKYTRLKKKFDALTALKAQKKEAAAAASQMITEGTFQVATAQGEVTPQFSSSSRGPGESTGGKDDTPKSILKTPLKSSTPQAKKHVKFVDDASELPSSGSTIIMGEANPDNRSQILTQHNDRKKAEQVILKTQSSLQTDVVPPQAKKRKICEAGPSTFKIPESAVSQRVAAPQQPIFFPNKDSKNKENKSYLDDDNSSTSSIMMADYAEELEKNPYYIHTIKAQQQEQRSSKKMKMVTKNTYENTNLVRGRSSVIYLFNRFAILLRTCLLVQSQRNLPPHCKKWAVRMKFLPPLQNLRWIGSSDPSVCDLA
ncbi:myosin heavy chain, skeletal muscle, adult-like isoform X2 [Frankliniella occidentalis]|uniref:Myosin heavy chain, skeletal muscle, adult-like isoform X2 n=1 Tax=Frankliniella occidentalis TaxID=133901 RepID=A0A9C6WLN6_FRAOC|nr:myosin heavy chain, skeletal muscle, adult-like isoform X2 [Frankliniella occidentalis]